MHKGDYYGNALQAAPFRGHGQILLAHGTDVNVPGNEYDNALQAASAEGRIEAVTIRIWGGSGRLGMRDRRR